MESTGALHEGAFKGANTLGIQKVFCNFFEGKENKTGHYPDGRALKYFVVLVLTGIGSCEK